MFMLIQGSLKKLFFHCVDDVTNFFCKMRVAVATLDEIDLKAVHRYTNCKTLSYHGQMRLLLHH